MAAARDFWLLSPVEVMDYDVLLHDALVVIAPGVEGAVLAAEFPEAREGLLEAAGVREPGVVDPRELLDLVVHLLEIHGLDVDLELLAGGPVVIQADGADLDDLAAQMDREPVEDGGFGAHRLVPFHVDDNVADRFSPPFSFVFLTIPQTNAISQQLFHCMWKEAVL